MTTPRSETARDEQTGETALNWAYGCGRPDDWGDDVADQIRKQNFFWNRLVELDNAHRTEFRAITAEDPDVAAVEAEIAALETQMTAAQDAKKQARQSARRKSGDDIAPHEESIKDLAKRLKPLRERAKAARKAARERMSPLLKALEEKRRAAVTKARQQAAADGLWWGNYNAVLGSFETARQRALKTGAVLRFHRFDGAGRLTVQVQGGMTPEQLFSGARSEVRIDRNRNAPNGKPSRWSTLHITAYAQGRALRRTLSIPIMVHREFPAGAVIKGASLIRNLVAPGHYEYHAVFQVVFPTPETIPTGVASAGIDFGWRMLNTGLRVAVLADSTGAVEQAVMPGDIMRRLKLGDEIQSDIDHDVNERWTALMASDWSAAPPEMAEALKDLRTARRPHPRHMARLLKAWPENWEAERRRPLAEFLQANRKEYLRLARTRRNAQRARQDWQRKLVAGWLRRYRLLVVDAVDMRSALRAVDQTGTDSPLNTAARRNARIGAVGELRAWIIDAGRRAGVQIIEHKGGSTWTCHECGTPHKPANAADLFQQCGSCGTLWDQDENAARNLLRAGMQPHSVAAE